MKRLCEGGNKMVGAGGHYNIIGGFVPAPTRQARRKAERKLKKSLAK